MTAVRDRLSERVTTGRVKLEARRAGPDLVVLVLATVLTLAGAGWILAKVAPGLVKSGDTVAFEVDEARAVKPGLNEIRVRGVPAGRVTGVDLVDGRPVITAEVEEDFGEIYRDAKVELRPNSALEDQFLDVVDRGTPSAGEATEDTPVPSQQVTTPVSVDDVLSTFNGDTRTRLRVLLTDLGKGLDDRGSQLGEAFAAAVPLLHAAGELTEQVARRAPMTKRLVHNTGVLTQALAARDRQLRTLVRSGSATLSALQEGSGDLDATLRALPPTLATVDTSFAATRSVLGEVNGAVEALSPVADKLDGTLASVRQLGADAAPAITALQTPVRRLVPFSRSLMPLSRDLATAILRLRPQTDTLNTTTRDLAACKKGVQGFFQWDASMTKYGDSRGQAPRGNLAVGAQSGGFASPYEAAYAGCVPGAPIGGRPPAPADGR